MKLLDTSVVDIDRGGIDRKVRKLDEQGTHRLIRIAVTLYRRSIRDLVL